MKKYILSLSLLPSAFCLSFSQYASQNVTLLAHWDTTTAAVPAEPGYGIRFNSPWGWVDTDNKEYAILGASSGTYFIEVTNPSSPKVRDFVPGRRDSCIWREYKTYQKYCYAVSDDGAPNSMQIIDMSYLPDSVHVVYDQSNLVNRSHSIFIDEQNATMYLNSVNLPNNGNHSNMAVFSLANPESPVLLRRLEQDYPSSDNVHDSYVRNDTCYASSSNSGLFIYRLTGSNTFSQIGSLTSYPQQGYNHSSALTANSKTLIFADEVPVNLHLKSLDVSNMGNLTVLDTFQPAPGDSSTPHNPFIRNGDNSRVVVAYYQSGVQIFDITNPANITRAGYFDTSPTDCPGCPNENYSGCWGVYVDLPSGIILASDMQDGLFVLDASLAMGITPASPNTNNVDAFPNPFTHDFEINLSLASAETISYKLTDITGRVVLDKQAEVPAGKTSLTIDGKNLSAGAYMLNVKGEGISLTKKMIRINK